MSTIPPAGSKPSSDMLHATLAIDNISLTLVNVLAPTFTHHNDGSTSDPNAKGAALKQKCPFTHASVCFERIGKKGSRRSTRWMTTTYPQIGDDIDELASTANKSSFDRVLYFGSMSNMYFPIQVRAESQATLEKAYSAARTEKGHLIRQGSTMTTGSPSTFNAVSGASAMFAASAGDDGLRVAAKSKHPLICTVRCFDIDKAKLDFEAAESSYFQQGKPFYNAKVSEFTSGIDVDIAACINNALKLRGSTGDDASQTQMDNSSIHSNTADPMTYQERSVVNKDGSITYTVNILVAPTAVVSLVKVSQQGPVTIRLQFTARCERLSIEDDIQREILSVDNIVKKIRRATSALGLTELTPAQITLAKQLDEVLHDGDAAVDEEPITDLKGNNPPTLFSLRMYNNRRHAAINIERETVVRGGGKPSGGQTTEAMFPPYDEPINLLDPSNGTRVIATNESFITANSSASPSMNHFGDDGGAFAEGIPGGTDNIAGSGFDREAGDEGANTADDPDANSLTGLLKYIHPATMAKYVQIAESGARRNPSVPTPQVPSFARNRHYTNTFHDYCIVLDSISLNVSMITSSNIPGVNNTSSYGLGFFADITSGSPANYPPFMCPALLEPDASGNICFALPEGQKPRDVTSTTQSSTGGAMTAESIDKSWCIFSCRSSCYSNLAVGRREIVTSRFKTVTDDTAVSPIPGGTIQSKLIPSAAAAKPSATKSQIIRAPTIPKHSPEFGSPTCIGQHENGLCKSSQKAKLVFCLVRVSKDDAGVARPCSEAANFQALDLAAEVLNVENYPHDGVVYKIRFNYGETLQFRLRRRCFRAPLVHLSALLQAPLSSHLATPQSKKSSPTKAASPTQQVATQDAIQLDGELQNESLSVHDSPERENTIENEAPQPEAEVTLEGQQGDSAPTSQPRLYSPQTK